VGLGDARDGGTMFRALHGAVNAVITSPPYFDVTNFEEDQWLRLWFLGYAPRPTYRDISRDDRYRTERELSLYWEFLAAVWKGIKPLLARSAVIVCRLGAKSISQPVLTRRLTTSLREAFPKGGLVEDPVRSEVRNRQRDLFQPGTEGCLFEVDYVFSVTA
jgi:hypothetical protein